MAATATNGQLVHVGFMVPLNDLLQDNSILERTFSHIDLRYSIYAAVLYYRTSDQCSLNAWYDQRKRSSRSGYLRAYYANKKSETIIEMDVDGKPIYLIAASSTSKPPVEMKKDIARGLFGERKSFESRIEVPCFPYKFVSNTGFIECEAYAEFKKESQNKQLARQKAEEEKSAEG